MNSSLLEFSSGPIGIFQESSEIQDGEEGPFEDAIKVRRSAEVAVRTKKYVESKCRSAHLQDSSI